MVVLVLASVNANEVLYLEQATTTPLFIAAKLKAMQLHVCEPLPALRSCLDLGSRARLHRHQRVAPLRI
jgi:hypothetical protein